MGSVYKALDTRLQRLVALKVLHVANNPEAKPLFLREATALARLNHPNIVQVYDVGYTETLVYIAFEYIEGRTLDQIVAGTKPIDLEYAIEIICQVGMALSSAHQRGVIHRDLKPSNILISHDGRVLLLDFGLATAPRSSSATQTGTIAGTPAYMSPEQAMGKLVDGGSDIFSLGVVLYRATYRHAAVRRQLNLTHDYECFSWNGVALAICSPRSPANRRAKGSRNRAFYARFPAPGTPPPTRKVENQDVSQALA
jgi:eukaryotic-like serine/threonine-protein kinase